METWIVIESFERDMGLIGVFDNYEDTLDCMKNAFFEVFDNNFPDGEFDENEEEDYFCGVGYAWLNGIYGNFDWQIFKI